MMNSPDGYKEENENKTLEQLVLERTKLFNGIVEYEQQHIMNNEPYGADEIVKPSPKDIYRMHNLYLKEITDLIIESNGFVNVDKNHEEYLEKIEDFQERLYDKGSFFMEIRNGAVIPIFNPNYYNKTEISLIEEYNSIRCNVLINKNEYSANDKQFSEIKQLVKDNLDKLIQVAERQTNDTIDGTYNAILIKIGSILLNISSQNAMSDDDYKFINEFKEKILNILIVPSNIVKKYTYDAETKKWIIEDLNTTNSVDNYMKKIADEYEPRELTEEEKEFEKYSKLYEEKFGKRAYIAEPSGTMEQTIKAIKICLEKNEDLLDNLLYQKDSHYEFYKKNENDTIWWVDNPDSVGENLVSFDKKKIYNLFKDYPYNFSDEEKELFDKENPYWADYFKDRKKYENNNLENASICPHCKNKLSFMMPDGKTLYCNNCNKYFVNNDGVAGEETGSPYTRKDVLY